MQFTYIKLHNYYNFFLLLLLTFSANSRLFYYFFFLLLRTTFPLGVLAPYIALVLVVFFSTTGFLKTVLEIYVKNG